MTYPLFDTRILALVAMSAILVACEQTGPDILEASHPASVERALASIEFSREPDASMADLRQSVEVAMASMEDIAGRADDWHEAHAIAQQKIADAPSGVIRASVEQAVAKLMLVGYLVPSAPSEEASALSLQYANLLVDQRSPEAESVLETVEAFGAGWTEADRRAVALGAAEAVEAYVREGAACRDCELPAEMRRAVTERGQTTDIVSLRRLEAAEQLRALAG